MKPTTAHPHRLSRPARKRALTTGAFVTALASAVVLGFAGAADAARRHGGPGWGAGHGMGHHGMLRGLGLEILDAAEKLDLKDDQIARLKEIRKSAPGLLMPKSQALMEARIELQDLMSEENAAADALRQAHQRVLAARTDMQAATFDLRMQVRDVLTPKQRVQLQETLQQRVRQRPMRLGRQSLPRGGWDTEEGLDF